MQIFVNSVERLNSPVFSVPPCTKVLFCLLYGVMIVVIQERRREEEARKAQEILQRRRNREDEAEYPEMLVSWLLSVTFSVHIFQ